MRILSVECYSRLCSNINICKFFTRKKGVATNPLIVRYTYKRNDV
jgi:hypothetical protein